MALPLGFVALADAAQIAGSMEAGMTLIAAGHGSNDAGRRQELAGLKVADFSSVMAGPYCTRLLADLGADVIKVESPVGDHVRTASPMRNGHSSYFGMLNAGKRDVVLDLKIPQGRSAAAAIVAWADVVVENFRPGVMRKFGLDYETLAQSQPGLVYCSISGYGQTGPWIGRPATAQAIHATSGFDLALLSFQEQQMAPLSTGLFVADALAGSLAFGAVLAALRSQERTGVGGHVDLSMLDSLLSMMVYEVQTAQFPQGYDRKGYPPARTRDGYVMIAATSARHLAAMLDVIGRRDLLSDPRFNTTESRWRHAYELHEFVEQWTLSRSASECERAMVAAGVPAAQYGTVAMQLQGEQLRSRGSVIRAVDAAGEFAVLDVPFKYKSASTPEDDGAPRQPLRVPCMGEHTREVLHDLLGAQDAEDAIDSGGAMTFEDPEQAR